ncbi:FAD/NAD(P)-binding domain-containing protein [Aspergillus alliaceus]|uniref:FAD/NAD(P)-binding domain-containing protein n=1 Tax=Petromyces alliaceus TaxID=209559 RepID=A0A5N7CG29_PETAA|nr:FAD/NAD(P)-binding domain-containing protein [Aspergillus alliaceus]
MSIPEQTTILVIGGGPAGSYAASVLAREGLDTAVLEAEVFPRYHIGESMLPSLRNFLRFIDLEAKFKDQGFTRKNGASFKLNDSTPAAYTDFLAVGGPENYTWNVVRSEADDLMFRHAGESGAQVFDGVKVTSVNFEPDSESVDDGPGRPVSASWSRKDGSNGIIQFRYLIDATGRAGLVSTKYLKNRVVNNALKGVATWGYWEDVEVPGAGTPRENDPYFEAISDGSGWTWAIPLQNNTTSVGVVMSQDLSTSKKRSKSQSSVELYKESLNNTPGIQALLANAKLVSDSKSASDWSYRASSYASPYLRLAGDAGCFIDPFFSSGVHLALNSGLSAAVTICAAERHHCSQTVAANWHSQKVSDAYTRFLMVISATRKQIANQNNPILNDFQEDSFDRAFAIFQPVIQGAVDVPSEKLSQDQIAKIFDFCSRTVYITRPGDTDALAAELGISADIVNRYGAKIMDMKMEFDKSDISDFETGVFNGLAPRMERGALGLVRVH